MQDKREKNTFDIDRLCAAAHISLTDEEKERFNSDIAQIIDFAGEVSSHSFEGAKEECRSHSVFREDVPEQSFCVDEMTASAPVKERGMPCVVRVVEGG